MRKEVFRGLAGISSVLMVVSIIGSPVATSYSGRINTVLGISTSKIVSNEESDENTNYYTSDYGTDIYDLDQLTQLEADAAEEEILQVEEGVVLLKNDNNVLPLKEGSSVSLFGNNTVNPNYSYHSTSNSMQELVTYVDAMSSVYDVNEELITAYENSGVERVKSVTDPIIGEAPISLYTDSLKSSWVGDNAIVLLTRQASEDCDLVINTSEGVSQLALSQNEKDMLEMLKEEKENGNIESITVLLNSNYAMEVGWLDDYDVDACLWIGTPGIVGFTGVANVLIGDADPSGRLTDTYAVNSLSAPAIVNAEQNIGTWANADEVAAYCSDDAKYVTYYGIYAEGIYVGYKYYETRYEDTVLGQGSADSEVGSSTGEGWNYTSEVSYPFGYGLSYTTFEQTLENVTYDESTDNYTVTVKVKNTGSVSGKSVVEIYAQTPYGDYEKENLVEKAAISLVGFGKTSELAPNEETEIEVEVERYLLASYDTYGVGGYILSAGDYYLALGDDAHDALNNVLAAKDAEGMVNLSGEVVEGDADKVYAFTQEQLDSKTYSTARYTDTEVTNQFEEADINYWLDEEFTYLSRQDWEGTYPTATSITATEAMMEELDDQGYEKPEDSLSVSDIVSGEDAGLTWIEMKDVDYDDEKWETFLNQLTLEEMLTILPDQNGSAEITSINLPASYRGDDMDCLEQVTFKANGKSGIVWPSAVLLAATWNQDCVARRAAYTGNEAFFMGCTEIWSGGPNFHRTQYCGRNNAYYSEDATLDYIIGTVMTENCQKYGVILGYKHLVLNDQELHRESMATFANEQTIREIYLRAFEGAYSKAGCLGVMTAFNRVGLTYSGSCSTVMNDILRAEWGFRGVICSDAVVGANYKSHYAENITSGLDYWCWDMEGFGPPPDANGNIGGADNAQQSEETEEVANGNSGTYDAGGVSSEVLYTQIMENDDGYLYQAVRTAVKNQLYAELKTSLTNGLSTNAEVVSVTPWWTYAITALKVISIIVTVLFTALFVLCGYKEMKGGKEQNEK